MSSDMCEKTQAQLAGAVASRLCHDLISPIGAISNGLELLELSGGASEELRLIRASVDAAAARIGFFRIAFGTAASAQDMNRHDVQNVLSDAYSEKRITLNWADKETYPRAEIQLAFLALACLEHALAWGGSIEVRRATDAWVLHAKAERFRFEPDLWAILSQNDTIAHTAGDIVHFALLHSLCKETRRPISVTKTDQSLSILV